MFTYILRPVGERDEGGNPEALAIPYVMRSHHLKEIRSMSAPERTEVLTDQKAMMQRVMSIFSRAKRGVDILAETLAPPEPSQTEDTKKAADAFFDVQKRGGRLRILTKIDGKNVAYLKELAKKVEIR